MKSGHKRLFQRAVTGANQFEMINAAAWIGGGASFVIGFTSPGLFMRAGRGD
jgi:hypothetical protein